MGMLTKPMGTPALYVVISVVTPGLNIELVAASGLNEVTWPLPVCQM